VESPTQCQELRPETKASYCERREYDDAQRLYEDASGTSASDGERHIDDGGNDQTGGNNMPHLPPLSAGVRKERKTGYDAESEGRE